MATVVRFLIRDASRSENLSIEDELTLLQLVVSFGSSCVWNTASAKMATLKISRLKVETEKMFFSTRYNAKSLIVQVVLLN